MSKTRKLMFKITIDLDGEDYALYFYDDNTYRYDSYGINDHGSRWQIESNRLMYKHEDDNMYYQWGTQPDPHSECNVLKHIHNYCADLILLGEDDE